MKNYLRVSIPLLFLIFILSACGARDLSTVKTSLYGHWQGDNGTEYYFSDDGLTTINDEKEVRDYKYKVLEYDEVKNLIELKMIPEESDTEFISEYFYSNDDRDKMVETTQASSFQSTNKEFGAIATNEVAARMTQEFVVEMEYIDSTEKPK